MKFLNAVRVGKNITDIMRLPCVVACRKENDRKGFEWFVFDVKCGHDEHIEHAEEWDFIAQLEDGTWTVYAN